MNKRFNIMIYILLVSLLLISCKESSSEFTEEELETILVIDGEEIASIEFDDYMDRDFYEEWVVDFNEDNKDQWADLKQIEERFQAAVDEDLKYFIRDKAAIKDAKEKGIKVTEEEIEDAIEADLQWYKERIKKDERAKKKYKKNFDKNDNPTEYNLKITEEKILLDKHWEYYVENLEISEKEMAEELSKDKDFYIKVDIDLISSPDKSTIDAVYEEIEKGKDISAFLSNGDLKVESYGDGTTLDYYREFLGENLADELHNMTIGEISPIIKEDGNDPSIYYIVRVNDRKEDLDELKSEIKRSLAIDKYDIYMDELVDSLEVEINRDKIKPLTDLGE